MVVLYYPERAWLAIGQPPPSFATGSAVVNMLRQVGFAVGVAMLMAVIGSPSARRRHGTRLVPPWLVRNGGGRMKGCDRRGHAAPSRCAGTGPGACRRRRDLGQFRRDLPRRLLA
jgi:hypothetical protein